MGFIIKKFIRHDTTLVMMIIYSLRKTLGSDNTIFMQLTLNSSIEQPLTIK